MPLLAASITTCLLALAALADGVLAHHRATGGVRGGDGGPVTARRA